MGGTHEVQDPELMGLGMTHLPLKNDEESHRQPSSSSSVIALRAPQIDSNPLSSYIIRYTVRFALADDCGIRIENCRCEGMVEEGAWRRLLELS
jgi:hypothetical protein